MNGSGSEEVFRDHRPSPDTKKLAKAMKKRNRRPAPDITPAIFDEKLLEKTEPVPVPNPPVSFGPNQCPECGSSLKKIMLGMKMHRMACSKNGCSYQAEVKDGKE